MSKTILRAELRRLKQLDKVFKKQCPVCKAAYQKRRTYNAKYCFVWFEKTACPPSVSRRCRKIVELQEKFEEVLNEAIVAVELELEE